MEEHNINHKIHSEDINDIISTPPSWILKWGISLILIILLGIIVMAAFIRYPDTVKTTIQINAANSPKPVISKISGNVIKLLTKENDIVVNGQSLAWIESTANHSQVLALSKTLQKIRNKLLEDKEISSFVINTPIHLQLGELQSSYQNFYQSFLNYKAAIEGGIYLKRRAYIIQNISNIKLQKKQLLHQKTIREKEFQLAQKEFEMYQKLAESKVLAPIEFQQQQSIYLSKQLPLQQVESLLLSNESEYTMKTKELADLDNQILEEKAKFMQAINSLISEIDGWKSKYILSAPQKGEVVYAGIIQENQFVKNSQEIFYINPGSTDFFGEIQIPQYNMGKVKPGQEVLIKLNSYPFEEYGILKGMIKDIMDVPYRDSVFFSKVILRTAGLNKSVILKTGMKGSAEIITEDMSLLMRLTKHLRALLSQP